jgi:hypothetical protein
MRGTGYNIIITTMTSGTVLGTTCSDHRSLQLSNKIINYFPITTKKEQPRIETKAKSGGEGKSQEKGDKRRKVALERGAGETGNNLGPIPF